MAFRNILYDVRLPGFETMLWLTFWSLPRLLLGASILRTPLPIGSRRRCDAADRRFGERSVGSALRCPHPGTLRGRRRRQDGARRVHLRCVAAWRQARPAWPLRRRCRFPCWRRDAATTRTTCPPAPSVALPCAALVPDRQRCSAEPADGIADRVRVSLTH